jgi:TolB protein
MGVGVKKRMIRPNSWSLLKPLWCALLLISSLQSAIVCAKPLYIEIAGGESFGVPVTVVPFAANNDGGGDSNTAISDIQGVIYNDLRSSGQFKLDTAFSSAKFTDPYNFDKKFWQSKGSEYLIGGKIEYQGGDYYGVTVHLVSVFQGENEPLISLKFNKQRAQNLRALAHYISDKIFEKLIGVPGVFSTRIAYVTVERRGNETIHSLTVADSDGFNDRVLVEANYPLMSPAWAPDSRKIAYVSFDKKRASIKIVDLHDGSINTVSNFPGINGAPKWSPDGSKLALVLSKTGSPKIYTLELASKNLTQLTFGSSLDTEPYWMPDGQNLVFTSNMGGRPQIYKLNLATGDTKRLTFNGDYNATPSVTPDGKSLVVMHRSENGNFNIAVQSLVTGKLRVLTRANQDESPSLAPNGMMILYGSQENDHYVLGAVSLDGRFGMRLPLRNGSVKDPAWSPFLIGAN